MDSSDVAFWEDRYRTGRTPWETGRPPPALERFLAREPASTGGNPRRVLLPGCGIGYEVAAFHAAGWSPLAVDYSPAAVARATAALGALGRFVRLADFFADDPGGPFDLVYERAFLCSMPPTRWPDYARRIAALLPPGGRLAGIFVHGDEPEPPPYLLAGNAATDLLGRDFELADDRPVPPEESPPVVAGAERWQVWRRR